MEFLDSKLDKYACDHTSNESELLHDLDRKTNLQVFHPRMLSGHLQGRFLSMVSHMINPNLILEIGTYTGYSALCMAEGLKKDGALITIDINEELEPFTQGYFDKSPYKNQIDFKIGNALDIVPNIN